MAKQPKMILIVDDDPNLLMFFKEYFKQEGYNTLLTDDPEKAVRMSKVVHPDLLVIDIQMPKIDGFGVLAKIREKTPEIKSVIVSAHVDGFEDRIKEAKVQVVLKKPVQFEELERHILKLLEVSKKEIQEKIPPEGRPEIRVLFIDDEREICDYAAEAFNEYGFPTDIAYSGEEGLEKAMKNKYDLIITDHSMHNVSGYEFVHKVRTQAQYKPYSIALTSAGMITDLKDKYEKLGVTDFFQKPVRLETFIEWLESKISGIKKRRADQSAS